MPQLIIDLTDAQYTTLTALHGQDIELMVNLRTALLNSSDLDLLRVDNARHTLTASTIATDGSLTSEQLMGIWPSNGETIPLTIEQQNAFYALRARGLDVHLSPRRAEDGTAAGLAVLNDDQDVIEYSFAPDGTVSAKEYNGPGMGWSDIDIENQA